MRKLSLILLISLTCIIYSVYTQTCNIPNDYNNQKVDCGYVGINQQQCQNKGCCWVPASSGSNIPWCFYPMNCGNYNFVGQNPGFDQTWYNQMYQLFMANLNIDQKGGMMAAPDYNTPAGSYVYDWMRDGGLSYWTLQIINNQNLSSYQDTLNHYVQWVINVQTEPDPNNLDIRSEPKFNLPNGDVNTQGWCRPQSDGPGIRSIALITYATTLIQNNQKSYVQQYLWTGNSNTYHGGTIKYDLDFIVSNWQMYGCDLWEDIQNVDFFWNRMAFRKALLMGSQFAQQMGDSASSQTYQNTAKTIESTILKHWNGQYVYESDNRPRDGAVIHAFVSFNQGLFSLTGPEIAGTINTLNELFCFTFQVNQQDNTAKIPGLLYGRYYGDTYAGGNPWQLLSSALAELFYQGAASMLERPDTDLLTDEEANNWRSILKLSSKPTVLEFAQASVSAGDSVLYRVFQHVKNDNYIVYEQISKQNGQQTSAKGLTWSYANIMRALHLRNTSLGKYIANTEIFE